MQFLLFSIDFPAISRCKSTVILKKTQVFLFKIHNKESFSTKNN